MSHGDIGVLSHGKEGVAATLFLAARGRDVWE